MSPHFEVKRLCANQSHSLWMTDTVEKVLGMAAPRNNRIIEADFLNRSCAFDTRLELILLGDPLKIFFQQYRPLAEVRDTIIRSTRRCERSTSAA
jgi:hypothetical protein